MLTTRHRLQTPTGTGQRNGFHRHIDSVNRDETSSYPFEGKFIPDNRQVDLLPNDIIIRKSPKGSKGNPINHWQYAHVPEPGLQWIWSKSYLDTELLDFRDAVDEAQKGMTKVRNEDTPLFLLPAPADDWQEPRIPNAQELFLTLEITLQDTAVKSLTWDHEACDLVPTVSRKRIKADTRKRIAEASQFIGTTAQRLPDFIRPSLDWHNMDATIRAEDADIFRAYFSTSRESLVQLAQTTSRSHDKLASQMAELMLDTADARMPTYRYQTWQQIGRGLAPMGFRLDQSDDSSTRKLYPA